MGVASGCGEPGVGVASGSGWNLWVWLAGGGCGWNLWVWLVGVVVRRYIDFLILLIPTPLVSVLFCSSIPTFCSFFKCFSFLYIYSYTTRLKIALCILYQSIDILYNEKCCLMTLQFFTNPLAFKVDNI